MRTAALMGTAVLAFASNAQVAIGVFGGGAEDRIWQTELAHIGVLGEFRSPWIPSAAVRASISFVPQRHEHSEAYTVVDQPEEYRWLSSMTDVRLRALSAAIDLKFPFENNACVGGYYKGTYLLAGIGYAQRWQSIDQWERDLGGTVTTSHAEKVISEPMLRAGFGGEWNFSWGGPFIEGLITVSAPGLGLPAVRFPGAAMLSIGYRYSFAKPEAEE